jgi:tRNA G10  N-methylase Trm11
MRSAVGVVPALAYLETDSLKSTRARASGDLAEIQRGIDILEPL